MNPMWIDHFVAVSWAPFVGFSVAIAFASYRFARDVGAR